MSNAVVEGLFLLAFWAPPLAVVVSALLLLVTASFARRSSAPADTHLAGGAFRPV